MKKRKKILILITVILIIFGGLIIYSLTKEPSDSTKFKQEYENSNKNIDKDNPIVYLNDKNLIKELTKGNKLIYFGYPECKECSIAVSVLLDAAKDNGIEEVYYYNPKKLIDYYKNDKKKSNKEYNVIIEKINNIITNQIKTTKIKQLEVTPRPIVILIKDGRIESYHIGTIDSYADNSKELTKKEYNKLYKIYDDMIIDLLMCTAPNQNC